MAMYNSQASVNGFKLSAPAAFKQMKEELRNSREEVESHLSHPSHHQQQVNSSLMRFRSAPSSILANIMNTSSEGCESFSPRSSSPDAESMFTRFLNCGGSNLACSITGETDERLSVATSQRSSQSGAAAEAVPHQNGYAAASQMIYHSTISNQNSAAAAGSPYEITNSITMELPPVKGGSGSFNLTRHSSSPAGLFSHLTFENGYAAARRVGNFRAGNGSNRDAAASTSRLKNQVSISPRQSSSPGMLSQISEMAESFGGSSSDDGSLGNDNSAGRCYAPGFSMPSWDVSAVENFAVLKRVKDMNGKMIPAVTPSKGQNGVVGKHTSGLSHQFSFPKTPTEMASMENFLQFQDSVPCKIRAKRGCATHPRSIAERVRRTRISERMRKLQELVPNMEKQTNTADMLDLAVEHIKDLQKQVQIFASIIKIGLCRHFWIGEHTAPVQAKAVPEFCCGKLRSTEKRETQKANLSSSGERKR
ncbi:hypothetical protein ACLOJK_021204 [Asimina triloba]